MPITYSEKSQFIRNSNYIAEEISLKLSNFDNSVLLFKVLAHALRDNQTLIQEFDESIFENPNEFRIKFEELLHHALAVATSSSSASLVDSVKQFPAMLKKEYTSGQLAKYFGVSVQTIHNWLDQGRFMNIERAKDGKHNKIPEDTMFMTAAGNLVPVSKVVELWYKQEAEVVRREESDLEYYTRQVAIYEERYGGEFERTLGTKGNLTPEEETDAQVWKDLIRRQKLEFRDSKE